MPPDQAMFLCCSCIMICCLIFYAESLTMSYRMHQFFTLLTYVPFFMLFLYGMLCLIMS